MAPIEPFYGELGQRIQRLRLQRKLTQEQLGARLTPPTTRASIANVEAGKQRLLTYTLVQMAEVLRTTVDELVSDGRRQLQIQLPDTVESELEQKLDIPQKDLRKLTAQIRRQLPRRRP